MTNGRNSESKETGKVTDTINNASHADVAHLVGQTTADTHVIVRHQRVARHLLTQL